MSPNRNRSLLFMRGLCAPCEHPRRRPSTLVTWWGEDRAIATSNHGNAHRHNVHSKNQPILRSDNKSAKW